MKKISIFALVVILAASLTGCWRRNQESTTAPSTSAPMPSSTAPSTMPSTTPSTAPSTAPTTPSTYATIPDSGIGGGSEATLPSTDGSSGQTGGDTGTTGNAGDSQQRSMRRY